MKLSVCNKIGSHHIPLLKFKRRGSARKPISFIDLITNSENNVLSTQFQVYKVLSNGQIDNFFQSKDIDITDKNTLMSPLPYYHIPRVFQSRFEPNIEISIIGANSWEVFPEWETDGVRYFVTIYHNVRNTENVFIKYTTPSGEVSTENLNSFPVFDLVDGFGESKVLGYKKYSIELFKSNSIGWRATISGGFEGLPLFKIRNKSEDPITISITNELINVSGYQDSIYHKNVFMRQVIESLNQISEIEVYDVIPFDVDLSIVNLGVFTLNPSDSRSDVNVITNTELPIKSNHIFARHKKDRKIEVLGISGSHNASWNPVFSSGTIENSYQLTLAQDAPMQAISGPILNYNVTLSYNIDPVRVMGTSGSSLKIPVVRKREIGQRYGSFSIKLNEPLAGLEFQSPNQLRIFCNGQLLPSSFIVGFNDNFVELSTNISTFSKLEVEGIFKSTNVVYRGYIPPTKGVWSYMDLSPIYNKIEKIEADEGYIVFLYPDILVRTQSGFNTIKTLHPIRHIKIKSSKLGFYKDVLQNPSLHPGNEIPEALHDLYPQLGYFPCIPIGYYQPYTPSLLNDLEIEDITRGGGGLPGGIIEEREKYGKIVENLADFSRWEGPHFPVPGVVIIEGEESEKGVAGVKKFMEPGSLVVELKN